MKLKFFHLCILAVLSSVESRVLKRHARYSGLATSNNYPDEWDPSPCECFTTPDIEGKSVIFCDYATTAEQIKTAFAKLDAPRQFTNFYMSYVPITSLPAGVFGKGAIHSFVISFSQLATIDDAAFQGSEDTAEYFQSIKNHFEVFNFKAIQPLKKLKQFELVKDKLTAVPDDAFADNPLLENIVLRNNQISTLGKNAFSKLPKLKKIDLGENQLTTLDDSAFHLSPAVPPIFLALDENQISTILTNAFQNAKLTYLSMEFNQLESLDKDIFKQLIDSLGENNGTIFVFGNSFNCDGESMKWIQDLSEEERKPFLGFSCIDNGVL